MATDAPKPTRRSLQFGLRALFVLISVVAIGMGFWVNSAERQKRVVAKIRSMGGDIMYADDPLLLNVERSEEPWYRKLFGDDYFSSVFHVELVDTKITDAGLASLTDLTKLEALYLNNTKVTDEGLKHLKAFRRLRILCLNNTKVTDAGLEHLQSLRRFRMLDLSGTQVTDAGLENLKGLTEIRELHLDDTQVTEAGIAKLLKAIPNCVIDVVYQPK